MTELTKVRKVQVTEVGPRDGIQADATFVPTQHKIAWINRLIEAGVPRIEATSFVAPRAVPQLADAAEVMKGVKRSKDTILAALVPNARGAIRAAEAGVDQIVVFMSASESHNRKNVNCSVAESLKAFEEVAKIAGDAGIPVHGAIATAFGCPFEGDVAVEAVAKIARAYQDMGFVGMTFGDTTGMATPPLVLQRVQAVREAAPKLYQVLHFHNTRGVGLANVMAGLAEGVDRYESAFGGTGGCPFVPRATGNICTEDLLYLLDEMGIETGIDLRKMMDLACDVQAVLGRELPGQLMKAGLRLDVHPMESVRTATG
ncbi:MAG: hydroxymethylglutaryl-CoA lyase [Thalassobaculum sp.]|uniref:hydroxymethylglutaryl-CoA lyase n=1 Tax=Thalassobaculum sp. TaxID=2022740 RepID=UPI0032EC4500